MRYLFTIQYLGTRYAGWQTQANATGIQQVVERALSRMCGAEMRIEGASRTDAGVHAAGQRAHADISIDISPRGLMLGLNDLLPGDIRIVAAEPVADTFHCRYDAVWKRYVYRIWNAPVADVFRGQNHTLVRQPLDLGLMREAAAPLVGTHDFRPFTVASPEVSSTVRTIQRLEVDEGISITVVADGFLRYMIRRIAGSLIEAGRGAIPPAGVWEGRWTAPAEGLTLEEIGYGSPC
jgi:tRNA pseudouridine38-40 synthase